MRDQINHYLDRARMAARVGIGRSTEIRPLVEPLVRALERINRERDIRISFDCPAGVRFQGEKQDLEEMLGNLLDNACKWAKRGVYLKVAAPPREAKGPARRVVITVEDDGKGLTADQRAAHRQAWACGSTRPSPAVASGCRSSPISCSRTGAFLRSTSRAMAGSWCGWSCRRFEPSNPPTLSPEVSD